MSENNVLLKKVTVKVVQKMSLRWEVLCQLEDSEESNPVAREYDFTLKGALLMNEKPVVGARRLIYETFRELDSIFRMINEYPIIPDHPGAELEFICIIGKPTKWSECIVKPIYGGPAIKFVWKPSERPAALRCFDGTH